MKSLFQKFQPAILVFALMFLGLQSSFAQVQCRLRIITIANPINSNAFEFIAVPGDSLSVQCFNANTVYNWTFGNGNTGTGQSVGQNFAAQGFYLVCVKAALSNGELISACDTVVVAADSNLTPTCEVSFTYQEALITVPLSYSFYPEFSSPACFPQGTTYLWTWGNGTSTSTSSNQPQTKTFPSAGNYVVCLRATPPNSTPIISCTTITVQNAQTTVPVYGMVKANGDCLNNMVEVQLISLNDGQQYSQIVNGGADSCFFWFNVPRQPVRNWVLRAVPGISNNFLPTYFGDVIFYSDATIFSTPAPSAQDIYNINLVPNIWPDSNLTDSILASNLGRVSGTIGGNGTVVNSTMGSNTMSTTFDVSKATVVILNAQNQPVGFAYLHADGSYFFNNLPDGQYSLRVEYPKVPSSSIPFTISTSARQSVVNFNTTSTGINVITGTNKLVKTSEMNIFPNPASSKISLTGVKGSIKIIDSKGRIVMETAETSNIEISKLPSGLYTITGLSKSNQVISTRFVKN